MCGGGARDIASTKTEGFTWSQDGGQRVGGDSGSTGSFQEEPAVKGWVGGCTNECVRERGIGTKETKPWRRKGAGFQEDNIYSLQPCVMKPHKDYMVSGLGHFYH